MKLEQGIQFYFGETKKIENFIGSIFEIKGDHVGQAMAAGIVSARSRICDRYYIIMSIVNTKYNRYSHTPKEYFHILDWPFQEDNTLLEFPLRHPASSYNKITTLLSELALHGTKTAAKEKLSSNGWMEILVTFSSNINI